MIRVPFRSALELAQVWAQELRQGALFLPDVEHPPGERLKIQLCLGEQRVPLEGQVVATVASGLQGFGATPGVAVQISPPDFDLRTRLEEITGVALSDPATPRADETRGAERFEACNPVLLRLAGRELRAETVDLSYNGMLVTLQGLDLSERTALTVVLLHPGREAQLVVDARVVNRTPCDHGVMAMGIQFCFEMDRVDEVIAFIDEVRAFHHAAQLGAITGSLAATPLETVLETFSSVASAGTLALTCGEESGQIGYADGQIVYALTGLVSGTKALGRMFSWHDARFEFSPKLDAIDRMEPVPLDSATLAAALQRDELARLDLHGLGPDVSFRVDAARAALARPGFDPLQKEVFEHTRMGFPLGAIVDMLPAGDAAIYQALVALLADGVIRVG